MAPYLSVVVCGSNSRYGGNFLERMQAFVDNLFELAGRYDLDADLMIVEWNPPSDRPQIHEVLELAGTIPVKIITVPRKYHESLPNPHHEKFFEYIAKNVGILRAEGEFILSTNPDNIYSSGLVKYLSDKVLRKDTFYRANRFDVRDDEIFALNFAEGSIVDRVRQSNPNTASSDVNGLVDYPGLGKRPILHFNAAGDFILMAREQWHQIHGHPETPYSLTVDGQTVFLAAQAGLKQVILPWPMYHADHSRTPKFCPLWSDAAPYGQRNNSWGAENITFDERRIQGTARNLST